jgi:hypothetical protein
MGKPKDLGEWDFSQSYLVQYEPNVDLPGIEPGPAQWEASLLMAQVIAWLQMLWAVIDKKVCNAVT